MAKKAAKKTAKKAVKKSAPKGDPSKTLEEIKAIIAPLEEHTRKFIDEEVKSHASKARGDAQQLRRLCGQFRKEIMEVVKSRRS